jgi:ABC-2 type transport system permease protein
MESYKAVLENEIFRMFKKKKVVVVVVLALGLIGVVLLLSVALRGGFGILGGTGSSLPITVLSVFTNTILPLFVALAVIDTFTGEFANDTMKITVTKPVTRFKIYLAKLSAVGVFILANLALVMVLSMIATVLLYPRLVSFGWAGNVFLSYLATFFPVLTLAVVVSYFANVLKSSTGVFFLTVLLFVLFRALGVVFSSISDVLVTSLLDWYKLWISTRIPVWTLLRSLVVMASYVLIFFALGYRRFDRRAL